MRKYLLYLLGDDLLVFAAALCEFVNVAVFDELNAELCIQVADSV